MALVIFVSRASRPSRSRTGCTVSCVQAAPLAHRQKHNATQVRTDDYSVIGAVLGALITPAIFLKRAPLPMLVVGGASLGLGAGVWAHLGKSLSEGKQVKPEGMVRSGEPSY